MSTQTATPPQVNRIPVPGDAVKQPASEQQERKPRISLAGRTQKTRAIPVPGFWDKTSKLRKGAKRFHNLSAEQAFDATSDVAERITGEVAGALSAAIRVTGGAVFGITKGLGFGVRGASPTQLKKIRMNANNLQPIGTWSDVETRTVRGEDGQPAKVAMLIMDLEETLDGEVAEEAEYTAPLAAASRETVTIDHVDHDMVCVPLYDEVTSELQGFIVASETDGKVYRFLDI